MDQKLQKALSTSNRKPASVTPKKRAKKSSNNAYKVTFFAIVGTLLWQSMSTSISNYQITAELEDIKHNQAIKMAEIKAARTQLQGVASKLVKLSNAGNQNAAEVIARFKNAGVDIRLNKKG